MTPARKHYEELISRNEEANREAGSDTLRDLLRTAVHVLFWICCGGAFLAMAWHTVGVVTGKVYWYAGMAVWIGGVSSSLLAAYRRGVERGDWT